MHFSTINQMFQPFTKSSSLLGVGLLGIILYAIIAFLVSVTIGLLLFRAALAVPPIRHLAQSIMNILMDDR